MIAIGPGGIPYYSKDHISAVNDLKERGLLAMEVEFVHGVRMSPRKADELGSISDGFVLTAHAPYYINLLNPEKRDASVERIKRTLDRASRFNAPSIAVHPGFYGNLKPDEALEIMDEVVGEIGDWMREEGISTKLGFETMGRVSQFGTLEEILWLSRRHRHLVPVVDFAHLYARNMGKIDYGEVLKKVKRFRPLHIHFSGIEFGEKGEKRHLPATSDSPPFAPLLKEMKRRGIEDAVIICESPTKEEDSEWMRRELKRIYGY